MQYEKIKKITVYVLIALLFTLLLFAGCDKKAENDANVYSSDHANEQQNSDREEGDGGSMSSQKNIDKSNNEISKETGGKKYYIDPVAGNDSASGESEKEAWKTLEMLKNKTLMPGDQILIKAGTVIKGKLSLIGFSGTEEKPIIIGSYGEGDRPIIDATGYFAGVELIDVQNVIVRDLEIVANGGKTVDGLVDNLRSGIFASDFNNYTKFIKEMELARQNFIIVSSQNLGQGIKNITLQNLYIHDIYPEKDRENEGINFTTYMGRGIYILGKDRETSSEFIIENCHIERTGHFGIVLDRLSNVEVRNNYLKDIGGAGINPLRCTDLIVRANTVNGTGSYIDERMHGRGSGIWPYDCERVLIEKNKFMHARGRADSCGAHIDMYCKDVIIQYNLSMDNEGGFVEILEGAHNCAYRYNISINDGGRIKGGKNADPHTIFIRGAVNNYIYNNTIYTKPEIVSKYAYVEKDGMTPEGLLIVNNVFYIEGETKNIWPIIEVPNTFIKNNLFIRENLLPKHPSIIDTAPIIGDPEFVNPGGLREIDYIPLNTSLIKDRGIEITNIPGDDKGLYLDFKVDKDYFGNPIVGLPDIGAVEISDANEDLIKKAKEDIPDQKEDADTDIKVRIDGRIITLIEEKPAVVDGEILVPMIPVFEYIGAEVEWDAEPLTVTTKQDGIEVVMKIGEQKIKKIEGGLEKEIKLDNPLQLIDDIIMIPLQSISEAYEYTVDWDEEKQIASIRTKIIDLKFHATDKKPAGKKIDILKVSASTAEDKVQNVIDGDLNTRWSMGWVPHWVKFELESEQKITAVGIASYLGDKRVSYYDIEVSKDGIEWTKVLEGDSSGKTADMEYYYLFEPVTAKYLRIVTNGCSEGPWSNIVEVEIYGE